MRNNALIRYRRPRYEPSEGGDREGGERERAKGMKQWEKEHLQKKVLACVNETEGSLSSWDLNCQEVLRILGIAIKSIKSYVKHYS